MADKMGGKEALHFQITITVTNQSNISVLLLVPFSFPSNSLDSIEIEGSIAILFNTESGVNSSSKYKHCKQFINQHENSSTILKGVINML